MVEREAFGVSIYSLAARHGLGCIYPSSLKEVKALEPEMIWKFSGINSKPH